MKNDFFVALQHCYKWVRVYIQKQNNGFCCEETPGRKSKLAPICTIIECHEHAAVATHGMLRGTQGIPTPYTFQQTGNTSTTGLVGTRDSKTLHVTMHVISPKLWLKLASILTQCFEQNGKLGQLATIRLDRRSAQKARTKRREGGQHSFPLLGARFWSE